jgi:hypothetical protein
MQNIYDYEQEILRLKRIIQGQQERIIELERQVRQSSPRHKVEVELEFSQEQYDVNKTYLSHICLNCSRDLTGKRYKRAYSGTLEYTFCTLNCFERYKLYKDNSKKNMILF